MGYRKIPACFTVAAQSSELGQVADGYLSASLRFLTLPRRQVTESTPVSNNGTLERMHLVLIGPHFESCLQSPNLYQKLKPFIMVFMVTPPSSINADANLAREL